MGRPELLVGSSGLVFISCLLFHSSFTLLCLSFFLFIFVLRASIGDNTRARVSPSHSHAERLLFVLLRIMQRCCKTDA